MASRVETAEISFRSQNMWTIYSTKNYEQSEIPSLIEKIPPYDLLRVASITKGFTFKASPEQLDAERVAKVFTAFKAMLDAQRTFEIGQQQDLNSWCAHEEDEGKLLKKIKTQAAFEAAQQETRIQVIVRTPSAAIGGDVA